MTSGSFLTARGGGGGVRRMAARTADSSTYRLSDGSMRTEIYTEPIRYRDDAGRWADIDPTLVPTGVFGQSHSKATELVETFGADTATGAPVTVSGGDWSMGMELLGAAVFGKIHITHDAGRVDDLRLVQRLYDFVDPLTAFLLAEAVGFRRYDQEPGSVVVPDDFNVSVVLSNLFRTHRRNN